MGGHPTEGSVAAVRLVGGTLDLDRRNILMPHCHHNRFVTRGFALVCGFALIVPNGSALAVELPGASSGEEVLRYKDGATEIAVIDGHVLQSPAPPDTVVPPAEVLSPPDRGLALASGPRTVVGDIARAVRLPQAVPPLPIENPVPVRVVPVYATGNPTVDSAGLQQVVDGTAEAIAFWDAYTGGDLLLEPPVEAEAAVDVGAIDLCDFGLLTEKVAEITGETLSGESDEFWILYAEKSCGESGIAAFNGQTVAIYESSGVTVEEVTRTLAHELGHTFGLQHSGGFGASLTLEDVLEECETADWLTLEPSEACIGDLSSEGLDEYGDVEAYAKLAE
jgi:hypothetical protein